MLEMFTEARGVAVVGASTSPEKLGYQVLHNIIQYGYEGGIYPINPTAPEILGHKAYASVSDCPDPVDLAVILVPNKAVPGVLEQCGQRGLKGAVIITAGFREVGPAGKALEQQVIDIAKRYGMRIVGPNVLGIIDTVLKLNASFAAGMPRRGKIAFMSQSGALCTSILDMALGQGIGFSRFYSIGNKADINELDLVKAWAEDPETRAIMGYLEGITNGPEFIRVASEVTRHKPIIAIKSGTTSAGSKAVSSHTGTLAGSEAAYDAAFKQCGIIRAGSVQDLFDYAQAFARQPLLEGNAIAVITNAGGPGIMASDAIEHAGLRLAALTPETKQDLQALLPAAASVANPIDVLGDAPADRYALAHRGCAEGSERQRHPAGPHAADLDTDPGDRRGAGQAVKAIRQAGLRRVDGRCRHPSGCRGAALLRRAQLPGAGASRGGHRGDVGTSQSGSTRRGWLSKSSPSTATR